MEQSRVMERLREAYPSLSPRLQQAARYVLDDPDGVALHSMRRLAGEAGVNPATMVRLAQALDFPGYEAFRETFRTRVREQAAGLTERVRALQARRDAAPGDDDILGEMLGADLRNLQQTLENIDPGQLRTCAALLAGARRIYVIGLRSCYPVAYGFRYAAGVLVDNVVLLDGTGGILADSLRGIGPRDVLLTVSFTPYTRDTVAVTRYAARRRVPVIAITDSVVSPVSGDGEALIVSTDSPSVFQSTVAAVAVVQALVAAFAAESGERGLAGLMESEAQLAEFEAYWSAAPSPAMAAGSPRS